MSTKDKVLDELLKDTDTYISGNALAQKLNVSRNSIWKAVKTLQSMGYEIDAISNKGYKLNKSQRVDIVSEEGIRKHINCKSLASDIIVFNEINSTNIYAKDICSNEDIKNGTLIVAKKQTEGKGRMGRKFFSPSDSGIYFSLIIKKDLDMEIASLLTSCTAVAVCEVINEMSGGDAQIKWVNDIFLNGKKICGILTEASVSFENRQLEYAIIGIGINVHSIKKKFSEELIDIATSIEDETGIFIGRNELVANIINKLEIRLSQLKSRNFMDYYKSHSYIIGKRIVVIKPNGERLATAIDIDENAELIVRYDDGTQEVLSSGDARILRS